MIAPMPSATSDSGPSVRFSVAFAGRRGLGHQAVDGLGPKQ